MPENDSKLRETLQQWKVTPPLPPRFQERVWQRIECETAPGVPFAELLGQWFTGAFAKPAFAFAYVSILVATGLTFGLVQANQRSSEWNKQLEARYVQSVDPYQRGK